MAQAPGPQQSPQNNRREVLQRWAGMTAMSAEVVALTSSSPAVMQAAGLLAWTIRGLLATWSRPR